MKKKILITGSNGFLGNLAKEHFIQNYELVLVDISGSSDANFYKVDIGNFTEIDGVITKEKPNIIFHFASEIFDTHNKTKIYKTNVEGSNNIKKSAIKNKVENLIFTSTFSLYEENYNYLISESEPISCKNYYGITKSKVEKLLLDPDTELNTSIFRCPIIVDKSRAHRLGVLFEFLKDNCTLWILGDGSNKLQFVSASDLFIAIEKSINLRGKHIYNIGCEKVETMKETFKYLIKAFKKGYGFDTFTGLPEDWDLGSHIEKKGAYTNEGNVPKIKGGEFIVGKFEDTLPVFFSESHPMASVINFDADLYSSTICALNFSKSVMDKDTILIFDEFIINESWEQDEFRALNEFCSNNHYSYEVIAISFFTKQVAVKLIGI